MATTKRSDPTMTRTTRRNYAQTLRGGFDRVAAELRSGIVDRDVLGVSNAAMTVTATAADVQPVPGAGHRTDDKALEAVDGWLADALRAAVVSQVGRDYNAFVDAGYKRGLRDADTSARRAGYAVPEVAVAKVFDQSRHADARQVLYTRNYQELEGVASATRQAVTRELADGLEAGDTTREMARAARGRIDAVGKTRATALARSEVVRAHATATLERFDQLDVDAVEGQAEAPTEATGEVTAAQPAELETAGDSRVCSTCASLEGRRVDNLERARGYLPIHPNCRCRWVAVKDD